MIELKLKLNMIKLKLTKPWIPINKIDKSRYYDVIESTGEYYKELRIGKSLKKLFMGLS